MKQLILFRHADAEHGSFETADYDRKLTAVGVANIRRQALTIIDLGLEPDLIITSTAKRAKTTTNILSGICNYLVEIIDREFLYDEYTTNQFLEMIKEVGDEVETLFVVGHNPTISAMGNRLCRKFNANFKPAGFAVFKCTKSWNEIEVGSLDFVKYYE